MFCLALWMCHDWDLSKLNCTLGGMFLHENVCLNFEKEEKWVNSNMKKVGAFSCVQCCNPWTVANRGFSRRKAPGKYGVESGFWPRDWTWVSAALRNTLTVTEPPEIKYKKPNNSLSWQDFYKVINRISAWNITKLNDNNLEVEMVEL